MHHGGTLPRKWDSTDVHDGFEQWWRGSADRMLTELLPDAGIEVVMARNGKGDQRGGGKGC